MKTLDDQIADIEKLDELRREARKFRQEAIDVLSKAPYGNRSGWVAPGDDVEKAQVLRALSLGDAKKDKDRDQQVQSKQALIAALRSIEYAHLVPADDRDNVPVLRAACVLQGLAEIPNETFSETTMACFCRVVRELSEIVDPTWTAGAARAGEDSIATAFVTGECARALLALEVALKQTAAAAELLKETVVREQVLTADGDVWSRKELERQRCSLEFTLAALPHLIIETRNDDDELEEPAILLRRIESALSGIPDAGAIMRDEPVPPAGIADRMRTVTSRHFAYTASLIAWNALNQLRLALRGEAGFDAGSNPGLADRLRKGAEVIRDLLNPIEQFAESSIDRQIAAASPHLSVPVDGAELVFAATLFGLLAGWKRPKVRAAYEVLRPLLSSNGRLLSIKPFDLDSDGYRLNVATLEVTRRFADLLANLDVEPEPELITRLMLPIEYTRMPGDPADAGAVKAGWTIDPPPREPKSLWWLTAIAACTLESMIQMLDKTINRRVLSQFHVRQPETISLTLDKLFYPDYGLAESYGESRRSIAMALQQLRAHAGHGAPEKKPLFSLVLYGPPGTGKTTLVEAVAATAGVPLVEITPSDILVGGSDDIERRARLVFKALSKLTHVVILFDEFEQILVRRKASGEVPKSVIEFLTSGMLPKLKALYEASKTGRVSYVLGTNLFSSIDSAVTRSGRFDAHYGIYPPDVISRFGRLRDQFRAFEEKQLKETRKMLEKLDPSSPEDQAEIGKLKDQIESDGKPENKKAVRQRMAEAVRRTAGGPMEKLGKPGWLTAPEIKAKIEKTPFAHIVGNEDFEIEAEADYDEEASKIETTDMNSNGSKAGVRYWEPWSRIRNADSKFAKLTAGPEKQTDFTDENWKKFIETVDELMRPAT